jgi:hypothetical protein
MLSRSPRGWSPETEPVTASGEMGPAARDTTGVQTQQHCSIHPYEINGL